MEEDVDSGQDGWYVFMQLIDHYRGSQWVLTTESGFTRYDTSMRLKQ